MALPEPLPGLNELLINIGEAGQRIAAMEASEGAAGNISICLGWPLEVRRRFPMQEDFPLPQVAPALGGHQIIVTGSGRRLRDVQANPGRQFRGRANRARGQNGDAAHFAAPLVRAGHQRVQFAFGGA